MKKTYTISIAVNAILLLAALAVLRAQMPRELILKKNGAPLANLKADVLHALGEPPVAHSSTDQNGRLDLSVLPAGTETVGIALWDGTTSVYNGFMQLPKHGSRTIDLQGNRTTYTTKRTYADFLLFKLGTTEVHEDWTLSSPL